MTPRHAADEELQKHLSEAQRALDRALDVCRRVARSSGSKVSASVKAKARIQEVRLRKMLGEVGGMGNLYPYLSSDPDLAPESTKVPRARREAQERSARR